MATLLIGLLLGLGVLFAWSRSRATDDVAENNAKRVAVLPFENLGRPEDEYFADGITDELRGKLVTLPGLQVTASASSSQYKHTQKPPDQIAEELGVQYLLVGKVRWEKRPGGESRVRVSPELVQVGSGGAPTTRWQQPFDAPLTDVFQVQADIASRVAQALDIALGAADRERLAERPTENLAAYDAFLKGAATEGSAGGGLASYQRAIDYYERAVALDSTFAVAWAQLSRMHSFVYSATPTASGAASAGSAAERALALSPKLPEGYFALAFYYYLVHHDLTRALEESRRAWQGRPKDARFLVVVAQNELALGHREEGLQHLQEAQLLDPRSIETAIRAVYALVSLGRYREALQTADRGLALAPADLGLIHAKVEAYVAQSDLTGARQVLRAVPREVDPAELAAQISTWDDFYWVLEDDQQRLLLRLSPAPFGGDRAAWGFALAQTHALRGDTALARSYADSARLVLETRLRDTPRDVPTHASLGLAFALMGRKADAIRESERALALGSSTKNPRLHADLKFQLGRVYVLVGEPEKGLDLLEPLLEEHYRSPGWMRIDPAFAALRGNSRFARLVGGS
jgi:serine/threonine-protein kinase